MCSHIKFIPLRYLCEVVALITCWNPGQKSYIGQDLIMYRESNSWNPCKWQHIMKSHRILNI